MGIKKENSKSPHVVLVVSGLDPTGSAGLIADVRVLTMLGCHPCGIVTCETVQSSKGVQRIQPVTSDIFAEQLNALLDDLTLDAVKIGAIASVETIEILGKVLSRIPGIPVVLDPVFESSSGVKFLDMDGMKAMSEELLEKVTIATPNIGELGAPAGFDVDQSDNEMILGCAGGWFDAGVRNLLVTGIRVGDEIEDRLISHVPDKDPEVKSFVHPFHNVGEVHGTGCILSSAIAGYLAKGSWNRLYIVERNNRLSCEGR
jgi:hydroxymethylpyrimidine/phosphomethylpyrimidine kinase